ncbi:hypothetical protein MMC09_000911 [Bachmanniomyces sp. S44760]|nr:hypothetical protein [Bachmanniomyces sp. S44760]
MDPVFRFPASPGTPLFPVSPERANRQHLPQSPSLPSNLSSNLSDPFTSSHSRLSSDVQGKVAQFNSLNKEAIQRRKDHEAALKRAVVGREEAEGETRRLRETNDSLRREVEEGRGRERKVGERVESVMEELQRTKETHAHSKALYEKEVRRARKEAFKSASALVKLQEELKTARNRYTLMREDVEEQKRIVVCRDQETFAAQYQLVGVQEELEHIRQRAQVYEEETASLKASLKEEEVARIAAEGRLALPVSTDNDEISPPKKRRLAFERRESLKENIDPDVIDAGLEEVAELKEDLRWERKMRLRAQDLVDFMKMECQFGCCSCRLAEGQGTHYVHDRTFIPEATGVVNSFTEEESQIVALESDSECNAPPNEPSMLIQFSPSSGTFHAMPSPTREVNSGPTDPSTSSKPSNNTRQPCSSIDTAVSPALAPSSSPETSSILSLNDVPKPTGSPPHGGPSSPPTTPHPRALHIQPPNQSIPSTPLARPHLLHVRSTTTTIPLAEPFSPAATMTREEALESIKQRRGRARSFATGIGCAGGTPRKGLEGLRRDVSAPNRI